MLQKFSSPRKNAGGKIVPLPSLTAAYAAPEAIGDHHRPRTVERVPGENTCAGVPETEEQRHPYDGAHRPKVFTADRPFLTNSYTLDNKFVYEVKFRRGIVGYIRWAFGQGRGELALRGRAEGP